MIKGKGIYAWILNRCENGDMGIVVDRLKEAGMTHIIPKVADGIRGNINGNDAYLPNLTRLCHQAGIQVIPYHFVYGSQPAQEAVRIIAEMRKQPYDGLVINAEMAYRDLANPAQSAKIYCDAVKKELPDLPLALSSFRFPSYHRAFPFKTFLDYCDYNMPQVYWIKANGTVPSQVAQTIEEYKAYPPVPMIPTGAAFGEWGWVAVPEDQPIFVREVQRHGLAGCNWWEYYETFNLRPHLGQAVIAAKWEVGDLPPIDPMPEPLPGPFWGQCTAAVALTIRSAPFQIKGNEVGYLVAGEKRLVYKVDGIWWMIGENQWVSSNFMKRISDPVIPDPDPEPVPLGDLDWLMRIHTTDTGEHPLVGGGS